MRAGELAHTSPLEAPYSNQLSKLCTLPGQTADLALVLWVNRTQGYENNKTTKLALLRDVCCISELLGAVMKG